jgi:hypothetical protein
MQSGPADGIGKRMPRVVRRWSRRSGGVPNLTKGPFDCDQADSGRFIEPITIYYPDPAIKLANPVTP